MDDLIYRQEAIDAIDVLKRNYPSSCFEELRKAVDVAINVLSAQTETGDKITVCPMCPDCPDNCPVEAEKYVQPEQKNEELLPDGTLHLYTDADLSTVGRVLVSQNGTHYGGLYYADGEQKRGGSEFISWLLDEIWDEEMWELNYRAFPELLCRRLVRLGYLKEEGGAYVRLDKQTGGD